jgi:hypothetical protein
MTVTRGVPGVNNSAAFTPDNPGDEIFDPQVSKITGPDGNPFINTYTGGDITETIAGANQLTMTLADPGLEQLRSGKFNGIFEVNMDGVPFWTTQVSLIDVDTIQLLFEHRIIAKLRRFDSYLKVSRGSMTRAQFVFMMVNEIKDEEILYLSPEINVKQPVAVAKTPKTPVIVGKAPGFAPGAKLQVKGQTASTAQLQAASILLAEAVALGASSKVMQAIMCAGIQESNLGAEPGTYQPNSAGYWGVLQGGSGQKGSAAFWPNPHDVQGMAHSFLVGGKGFQGGGAIAYSAAHPTASPGAIAWNVERSESGPAPYQAHVREATALVEGYTNSSIKYAGSPPGVAQATGEFYRGQPGRPEDSWTAALRLSAEVQWRAFVAGRHGFYYVQDADLMRQQPRYLIDQQSAGIQNVTFDVETGKRLVVIRGVRVPKPSAVVLTARIDKWQAPPGTVVELADYGPANGRWLVSDIQRPIFDATATITLHAPQTALPEPVASTTPGGFQVSLAGITPGPVVVGGTPAAAIQAKAAQIIARHYPYVWGGGHAQLGVPDHGVAGGPGGGGSKIGFDCSGFVSACLGAAGLLSSPLGSGALMSWGKPGKGSVVTVWTNPEHVWLEVDAPGQAKRYVGTTNSAPGGGPGNEPWRGDSYTARFTARHMAGM